MSILVETDILLALVSPKDKHYAKVVSLLDNLIGEVRLSPYSLIELNLLIKSGEIVVKEVVSFYNTLSELVRYREISTFPTKAEYHGVAFKLREKYGSLTYFDSLHAAVGITEDLEVVSYDRKYAELTELKYSHPDKYINQ